MKLSVSFQLPDLGQSARTPWTGDQLVASPLLPAPGDCDDGEVGGMNGFGRVKTCPDATLSPQIPLARPGRESGPPR
jgi:hypothetical protein